jgi:RHS repeat-associated protein
MEMPGRTFTANKAYRYGFNGQEKSDEITEGDLDFGARIMDVRLGRFLSVDPFYNKFPNQSSYIYAGGNPIQYIDVEGGFKFDPKEAAKIKKDYPEFYKFIMRKDGIEKMGSSPILQKIWADHGYSAAEIKKAFAHGSGPTIHLVDAFFNGQAPDSKNINLNYKFAEMLKKQKSFNKQAALLSVFLLIVHEETHVINREKTGEPNILKPENRIGADDGDNAVNKYIGAENIIPNGTPPSEPSFQVNVIDAIKQTMYRALTSNSITWEDIPKPNFPTDDPTKTPAENKEMDKNMRRILLNGVAGTKAIVTIPERTEKKVPEKTEKKE